MAKFGAAKERKHSREAGIALFNRRALCHALSPMSVSHTSEGDSQCRPALFCRCLALFITSASQDLQISKAAELIDLKTQMSAEAVVD